MAAEQDLTLDEGTGAATPPPANGKKKLFLLIAGALLLVVSAVGATLWLMKDQLAGDADDEPVAEAAPVVLPVQYVIMKPEFVVSFQVGPRQRFLQLTLEIMTRQPAVVEALRLHDPLLRNEIIRIISEQDFNHLRTAEGRVELQQRLLEHIALLVKRESGVDGVEAVLFTNLVMQ